MVVYFISLFVTCYMCCASYVEKFASCSFQNKAAQLFLWNQPSKDGETQGSNISQETALYLQRDVAASRTAAAHEDISYYSADISTLQTSLLFRLTNN